MTCPDDRGPVRFVDRDMVERAFGSMLTRPEHVAALYEAARQAVADLDHLTSWLAGFAAALPSGQADALRGAADDLDDVRRNLRDALAADGAADGKESTDD